MGDLNKAANVSVGKPKTAGALFAQLASTATVPADATTDITSTFECLGYANEDGITNQIKTDVKEIKAWGGVTVKKVQTSYDETFAFTLIEQRKEAFEQVFGAENVTVDATTGAIKVKHTAFDHDEYVYVIEEILSDGYILRTVIPHGTVIEIDKIEHKADTAIAYGLTISAVPGTDGATAYQYMAKPAA